MKALLQCISTVLQYAATAFLGLLTPGAFSESVLAGVIMLLLTLIACPFTRNKEIQLIDAMFKDKSPMNKIKGWMLGVTSFVLMLVAVGCTPASESSTTQTVEVESEVQVETVSEEVLAEELSEVVADVEVHFIDVGQGDATLVKADGKYMLIDAGDNSKGTAVQNYLKKQGVRKLDYLILTHTDADHIGGADVIITKFDIDTLFIGDFKKDNKTYEELTNAIDYKNLKYSTPAVGNEYKLGNAIFTIVAPNTTYDDPNNSSIALLLKNGEGTFLFTGDCEKEAETDILANGIDIDCDVYKVGHHGSMTASSKSFLKAISPEYGVISCAEENSYGHPHAEALNNLRSMKVKIFRTDEQGSIVAYSNGTEISWNCAPSDTWKAGEPKENTEKKVEAPKAVEPTPVPEPTPTPEPEPVPEPALEPEPTPSVDEPVIEEPIVETPVPQTYIVIGNKNSKAFHRESCSHLPKEKNRVYFNSRDEALAAGYHNPCDYCNP